MKTKLLTLIFGLAAILIGVSFVSTTAYAKGETYKFSGITNDKGLAGSKLTAYPSDGGGGAFLKPTTFSKATETVTKKYGAEISGYNTYYLAPQFNLKSTATEYYPACATAPAFIALKSADATTGFLYAAPLGSNGAQSSCYTGIGFDFNNLNGDTESDLYLTNNIRLEADPVKLSLSSGYYNALKGPLTPAMNEFYKSIPNPPCSSQGCSDTAWGQWVGACWATARTTAADTARLTTQAGGTYDMANGIKRLFATCLAKKTNDKPDAIFISNLLKEVDYAEVNKLGSEAADDTKDNLALLDGPESEPQGSSCVIDGIGWLVCGVTTFLANVTDNIYGLIENMLKVPVINTDTADGTNGVYNAWAVMRNFANIGFVIGFLIIIFSQVTSIGVSNYGVKKTLPRLVIAAILVNLSYWISAIAVDLSNIIGAGIYDILAGVKNNMNIGISANWGNIIAGLLGGAGVAVVSGAVVVAGVGAVVAAGGGMAILFLALPLLLSAVLAVIVAALILVARQALVVILIIISPLAFVALLLPNTEKLFHKWKSAIISVLIMYPVISLIFGGAQIAGFAILSTAGDTPDPITTMLPIVIGQTVMVIPFFLLPMLITKFSGDNLSGAAKNMLAKGKNLIGGASSESRKAGMSRLKRSGNTMKYGAMPSGFVGKAVRKYGRKIDQVGDRNKLTDSMLSEDRQTATRERLGTDTTYATAAGGGNYSKGQEIASRATAAAEAEELKKALQPLVRSLAGMDPSTKEAHLKSEISAGGTRAAAALHYSASIGDSGFMRQQIATADATGNAELKRQAFEAVNANSGALVGKAPDLVKGAGAAFGNVKGADLANFSKDTAKAYMEHIQTLSGAELATAVSGFNGAVEDISKSADLQSRFSGDTGAALSHHAGALDPAVQAQMFGTAAIQGDGKIR